MDKRFIGKFFLSILVGAAILFCLLFWTYISSIILALLISSALYPVYLMIKKLFKGNVTFASLFMCIWIALILIIPVGGFVGTLSNEAYDFYNRSKDSVSLRKIQDYLEGNSTLAQRIRKAGKMANIKLDPKALQVLAASVGKNVGLFLSKQLHSMASNLLSFLIHFFLMIFMIYYIFRDGDRLKKYISELLPFPVEQQELVVNKFREMGRAIIIGNSLSAIIQGILGGFGFFLFGLGSPFLWGTVIGFLTFLPVVGASVVFFPASIILYIQGKTGPAIGYLVYNLCYSIIMENIIKPRFISKGMHMNPILVFIGILGGLKLFGILGVIYGPLIMTIFLTLAEIYRLEYKKTIL